MNKFEQIKRYMNCIQIKMFENPFCKLTLRDQKMVEKLCRQDGGIGDHVNFIVMLISQDMYDDVFRIYKGCLIKMPNKMDGKIWCQYPIGPSEKRKKAVKGIVDLYSNCYSEIVFFGASSEDTIEIKELLEDRIINVENNRDNQNYMLDAEEQIQLNGAKYASRRNKIRRFKKLNNWTYEEITTENMTECLKVNSQWYDKHEKTEEVIGEQKALQTALSYYDYFGLQGGLIRVDGKAVAFHIGTSFNDQIYMCLFMKSLNEYRDVAVVLLYEFMKRHCQGYKYINYSEDLGIPGLRLFKEKLQPKFFSPFYMISVMSRI